MADSRFEYRPDVLEELTRHGVRPTPRTRPELVHEFVSDLYRYELRRLRDRLLRREFRRQDYFGKVVELRRAYRVITMRPADFLV
jgi:hypothetical protein